MRKILLTFAFVALSGCLFAAEKSENYSALKAYKTAATAVPKAVATQLVRIVGENGKLHPLEWTVTFYDPSAAMDMRVVKVSRNEVLETDEPFAIFEQTNVGTCLNLQDIRLDSKDVINAIHRLCYDNKLPLYVVDIQLTKRQSGNVTPLWICTLKNSRNNEFGKISVSARTGKILETEGIVLTSDSRLRAEKSFGANVRDSVLGMGADMEQFFTGKRTVDQ